MKELDQKGLGALKEPVKGLQEAANKAFLADNKGHTVSADACNRWDGLKRELQGGKRAALKKDLNISDTSLDAYYWPGCPVAASR